MSKRKCVICLGNADGEDTPILTMGAYGNPKYLCNGCSELLETATRGREYEKIVEAMDRISAELSAKNVDDKVTVTTVTELLADSAKRAKLIKDGNYDFSLDDSEDPDALEDVPEELLESEEDKELDRKEEESLKKFDKVMNWVWLAVFVGVLAAMVYFFFFR